MDRCSRICDNVFLTADNIVDIVAMMTFTGYGVHSQCMLGNLAQYCKSRSAVSQSDWQLTADQLIANQVTGVKNA